MAKKAEKNLVIVESPSKASTIKGYLGSNYKVIASNGHVRDLPKSTIGVDVDNNFEAHYINIRGKGELIRELKKTNPDIEKNIFNSIHRANIDTLVSYKLKDEMHSFLDDYDAPLDNL